VASNLSFGSGVVVISSAQAHLTRVGTLPGPGISPYPSSYPGRPAEGRPSAAVSCCLSANGVRFSGHPIPAKAWAFLTVGLPDTSPRRTRSGLPRSAPSSCDRGGCPLDPGDGGALPAGCRARPAPAASQRPVPAPR
jgi:hypothetical protein